MKYKRTRIDKHGTRWASNPYEPDMRDTRPIAKRGLNLSSGFCVVCHEKAEWAFHFAPSTHLHYLVHPENKHVGICNDIRCARAIENIGFTGCGCGG